ncbi:mpv17 / PMP22 family domain-containing protein [Ditylenchus destructor]|nr:mpv17 / PMP22 family domain-containing protein [Ditylenchus destructor]
MLATFLRILNKRPLLTQMVSAGVIGAAGDAITQLGIENVSLSHYDLMRTTRFFLLPTFYIAPVLGKWFRTLEKWSVPGRWLFGSRKTLPLKKLAVDQIFFAPIFSASIIYNLRLMEGYSIKESWEKLVIDYWDIYKRSIQYWPCMQLINFYVIPLQFRVIFTQVAALIWNVFLSHKTQTRLPIPPLE